MSNDISVVSSKTTLKLLLNYVKLCLLTFLQSDPEVSIIKHSADRALITHQLFMLNVIRLFKTFNLKRYPLSDHIIISVLSI